RVCFEMKISEEISVKHFLATQPDPHVVHVGWSLDSCSTQLGEEPFSYGYGGTGKKSANSQFDNYRDKFAENDVIGGFVDKMLWVMSLCQQQNYAGCWDVLIQQATQCLTLIQIAACKKRSYVLDQTCYGSGQRRKMRPFEGFQCKGIVICHTDEDLKDQTIKQTDEEGKDVPDHVVLEMKANFTLPDVGDFLDEALFSELEWEETNKQKQYNVEGYKAESPPEKCFDNFEGHGGDNGFQHYDNRPPGGNLESFQKRFQHSGDGGYSQNCWGNNNRVNNSFNNRGSYIQAPHQQPPPQLPSYSPTWNPPGASSYNKNSNIPGLSANTSTPTVSSYSPPQPSYSQLPYNQGGYSQGYTASPPPPPPPPPYNPASYPPPTPTAQTYPQPNYNQYQQYAQQWSQYYQNQGQWPPYYGNYDYGSYSETQGGISTQ
uniref:Uncharacterized protein n=1 Tax=Otolemur garnettii TaxID=30611 RepID=H0XZA1_OTOGA